MNNPLEQNSNHNHFHYNIENIKPRFIPTYLHEQVFANQNDGNKPVRCTPTFHSTALNVQGYQPKTNQHLKHNQGPTKTDPVAIYMNKTNLLRQQDLNPDHNCCMRNSKIEWYDNAKNDLFAHIRCGSARQRKLADLSSNPVFGGNVFVPSGQVLNQCREDKLIQAVQQPCVKVSDATNNQQKLQEEEPHHNGQNLPQQQSKGQQNKQSVQFQPQQKLNLGNPQLSKDIQQLIQQQVQNQLKNQLSLQKDATKSANQKNCVKSVQKKHSVKKPEANLLAKKQEFNLNNDLTFGKENAKIGRKLNKTIVIGAQNSTFTVVRNR